jgi:hypothetical protein
VSSIAILVLVAEAAAQPAKAKDVDKPAALKLFEEGRAELAAGRADAACTKFEESIRKDPRAVGTLLNLGLCNERQGKVASALALFIEAYDRANEAGEKEQRRAAEEHIAALRPQVSIVAISYAAEPIPGEKLLIDDRVLARGETELALDPGPHTVVLTAPGRLPYETTIVAKVSTRIALSLPALAVPASGTSPRRLAAKIGVFGGGGLVVVAAVLGVIARQKYSAQFEGSPPHCGAAPPIDGMEVCDDEGEAAVASARSLAGAATIVGIVGLAAVATGATLWLTEPRGTRVVPTATSTGGGVAIVGSF